MTPCLWGWRSSRLVCTYLLQGWLRRDLAQPELGFAHQFLRGRRGDGRTGVFRSTLAGGSLGAEFCPWPDPALTQDLLCSLGMALVGVLVFESLAKALGLSMKLGFMLLKPPA